MNKCTKKNCPMNAKTLNPDCNLKGCPYRTEIEDCISRQAVDTLVDELARAISDERCFISRGRSTAAIMQDILDLPPVTPQPCEDAVSRQDVDAYIAKLMSGYLYDEERTRLEEFSAYLWELPPVTPRTNLAETSQDCISRSELLRHQHIIYDDDGEGYRAVYVKDTKAMPSVTPERPKGKWIELYTGNYKCSVCGDWWDNDNNEIVEDFKYCPNCGAEMSGGGENEEEHDS